MPRAALRRTLAHGHGAATGTGEQAQTEWATGESGDLDDLGHGGGAHRGRKEQTKIA